MTDPIPLSSIRDPVAFLTGARVPLHQAFRLFERVEWSIDQLLLFMGIRAAVDMWRDDRMEMGFALDPSNPDVARWCDRKIAEVILARMTRPYSPILGAALNISRKALVVTTLHADGRVYPWGFLREAERMALATIPCDEPHIPAARRALVLALFGRPA